MQEIRLAQVPFVGDTEPLAVEEGAAAAARGVELAGDGIVDDADRDLAMLLERDQRRPDRDVAHEVLRAVDGIDDPARRDIPGAAELLAEEPVLGERPAEDLDDRAFGFAVRLGHRRRVRLQDDLESGVVILERDAPGRPRRIDRGRQRRFAHVEGSSAGKGSPRSASTCP